jgi:phenylalanyl-tRNA synthetase alpha chain
LENAGDDGEQVDVSLPGKKISQGHSHPLTQTLESIKRVFESMGFSVFLASEIETEFYNFDALNVPEYHPARDLWDTFWLKEGMTIASRESLIVNRESNKSFDKAHDRLLLRTHTTAMQHHYMKEHNPPFRIITPGKCFRYEASDSSHDIQFFQVDGLVVDKDVSIANFKAIIEELFKRIFSNKVKVRMRPGYFPFVEPGFEIDIACYNCQGKDCPVCKGTGWLEVMGAGMVHPEVFKKAGYNPAHWQGFAFGMGVERIAMIKYGISDIRMFYQNDSRFLKQF